MPNRITIKARASEIQALRARYRLNNKSDDEVAQIVFDRILQDRNFHLPQNRTDSINKDEAESHDKHN